MKLRKFCDIITKNTKRLSTVLFVFIPLVCAIVYTNLSIKNWGNTTQVVKYRLPEKYEIIQTTPEAKMVSLNNIWEFDKLANTNTTVYVQMERRNVMYYVKFDDNTFIASPRIEIMGLNELGMTVTSIKPANPGNVVAEMSPSYRVVIFGIFFSLIGGIIIAAVLHLIAFIVWSLVFEKILSAAGQRSKFFKKLGEELSYSWYDWPSKQDPSQE